MVKRKLLIECTVSYKGKDFNRCDVYNKRIEHCLFQDCSFDRGSTVCVRANSCVFENCTFVNTDILSGDFYYCHFRNCDFSLANISDNTFSTCIFENCRFAGADFKKNKILITLFFHSSFIGSVTSLNEFRRSQIEHSEFGNCTIDYNVFCDCHIKDSIINIESFGALYGLHIQDLENVRFMLLGNELKERNVNILLSQAKELFIKNEQWAELFALEVNTTHGEVIDNTLELCNRLLSTISQDNYIPSEQITFLYYIFRELYTSNQLGIYPLHTMQETIKKILNMLPDDHKLYENFVLLYNNLNLIYSRLLTDFSLTDTTDINKWVTITFHFKRKPLQPIVDILRDCHLYINGCLPERLPVLIEERDGSYIAVVQMVVLTFVSFSICTRALSGSLKNINSMRASLKLLRSKDLPEDYYLEAIKPDKSAPISEDIKALLKLALSKTPSPELKAMFSNGINAENIEEITQCEE